MIALVSALWLATAATDDIARAHELLARLACDEALPLGRQIAADPAADEAEAREGLLIAGYCLAASGRVGDAEELFRRAVTEDVQLQAGFPMERRIQYLLDAARADVLAERARVAAERRAALAAQVTLEVEAPEAIAGGERASFTVRVSGAAAGRVRSVKLQFQRFDDPEFYSLPIRQGRDGLWHGVIGGVYTRSIRAYQLKWFVTASDEAGELQSFGSREAPHALSVAAGSEVASDLRARERLPPLTRLLFAGIGAPTATAAAAVVTLYGATLVHTIDEGIAPGARDGRVLGMIGLMAVPVSMVLVEYVTTVWLLDGWLGLVPAISVGVVTGIADVALLVALLRGADLQKLVSGQDPGPGAPGFDGELTVALSAVGLGAVTASVVPLALVAWDASQVAE